METITYYTKLVAKDIDFSGYITYVFENLEYSDIKNKYIMCVRFPNWDCPDISNGEIGFLKFREVEEGIDIWYDGKDLIPYKNSDFIFLKFIREQPEYNRNILVD